MKIIETSNYIEKVAVQKRIFTPEETRRIMKLREEGWSGERIGKELGVSKATIIKEIKRNGGDVSNLNYANLNKNEIQNIIKLHNEGMSLRSLADKFNVSPRTIELSIINNGGTIKNHQAVIFTPKQTKRIMDLYNKGVSSVEIAKEFGVKYNRIIREIENNNGKIHDPNHATAKQVEKIIELSSKGKLVSDIAKETGVSDASVRRIIKRKGGKLPPRENSLHKGKKVNNENTKSITENSFSSRHELVIQDLFAICNIQYDRELEYPAIINGKQTTIFPDYYFKSGDFYFEVFGYGGLDQKENQKYQNKMTQKISIIQNLKYIDIRKKSNIGGLVNYAVFLDKNVCQKQQCGQPLFSNISLQEILKKAIPLLIKNNIPLCYNYIKKLQELSNSQIHKFRNTLNIENTQSLNNPNIFRQQNQKIAQSEPISLQQIVSELSQQYESVQSWTPEEQVAVYFKTPENLQAAMGNNQNYNFQNYFNLNQQTQQIPQSQMARAAMVYKGDTNG